MCRVACAEIADFYRTRGLLIARNGECVRCLPVVADFACFPFYLVEQVVASVR